MLDGPRQLRHTQGLDHCFDRVCFGTDHDKLPAAEPADLGGTGRQHIPAGSKCDLIGERIRLQARRARRQASQNHAGVAVFIADLDVSGRSVALRDRSSAADADERPSRRRGHDFDTVHGTRHRRAGAIGAQFQYSRIIQAQSDRSLHRSVEDARVQDVLALGRFNTVRKPHFGKRKRSGGVGGSGDPIQGPVRGAMDDPALQECLVTRSAGDSWLARRLQPRKVDWSYLSRWIAAVADRRCAAGVSLPLTLLQAVDFEVDRLRGACRERNVQA